MRIHSVSCTTIADGSVTAYSSERIIGRVVRVFVDAGSLAATTDFAVTGESSGEAVYTGTDVNGDTLADPTTAAGVYLWAERIKVIVAQGGATKTGVIKFLVDDKAD